MALSRAAIVEHLQRDPRCGQRRHRPATLQRSSIDNFRKLENIFGVHTLPPPAAVVAMVRSTQEASLCWRSPTPRRERGATHGRHGDRRRPRDRVENSIVLDGSGMDRILDVDPYNMQATAQCGVPLQLLEDRAASWA